MILHTVNKSPLSHKSLSSCIEILGDNDAVLLIEDGVYGAMNLDQNRSIFGTALDTRRIFALMEDVQARGIESRLMEEVTLVDYPGFVDLVIDYQSSMSWL